MFVHYFVNYFVRLRTNHYTVLTVSPISFIFDSARNLTRNFPYLLFDILWKYRLSGENGERRERRKARWEKWLARWFTKCHLYTYRFSHFANIFSRSRQFDNKCIAGFIVVFSYIFVFLVVSLPYLTVPYYDNVVLESWITTKFSQNQETILKICPCFINNITKISKIIFPQFLKFSLNFYWNYLKFFQKLTSDNIFINCTNLSQLVKIVFDTYLNLIKLSNISKISWKASTKFQ